MKEDIPPQPGQGDFVKVNNNAGLKDRVMVEGSSFGADLSMIKKAEMAMEELSDNFSDWMREEVDRLLAAKQKVLASNIGETELNELYTVAHDLRGNADTMGHPYVTMLSDSLCKMIDILPDRLRVPPILIQQHVDAINAIVKEDIGKNKDPKAIQLVKSLRGVTADFIIDERKRAEAA